MGLLTKLIGGRFTVVDSREDTLGLPFVCDSLELQRMREVCRVPKPVDLKITLYPYDVESDVTAAFHPLTSDMRIWEVKVPVADKLEYSEDDVLNINAALAMSLRYVGVLCAIFSIFEDTDVAYEVVNRSNAAIQVDVDRVSKIARHLTVLYPDLTAEHSV